MSVLINFKICDNEKICCGVAVCPTGALSYNEEKETIEIDNDKCISCGACEKECPIGAIMVARSDEEYKKFQKEIDDDPRTTKDLFVDRYGASSISDFFYINSNEIEEKVEKNNLTLIELYDSENTECLLSSIPLKDITRDMPKETRYYKANFTEDLLNKYNIKKLPALLVFENSKMLGKIEGYYSLDEQEEFLSKINNIINK